MDKRHDGYRTTRQAQEHQSEAGAPERSRRTRAKQAQRGSIAGRAEKHGRSARYNGSAWPGQGRGSPDVASVALHVRHLHLLRRQRRRDLRARRVSASPCSAARAGPAPEALPQRHATPPRAAAHARNV
jgi:hypothetical protein